MSSRICYHKNLPLSGFVSRSEFLWYSARPIDLSRMRRWQKLMIVALTIIAIGATGFAQWWTLHERKVEEVRRVEVREQLGKFIEEGQSLQFAIASKINEPVPEERVRTWEKLTEGFLQTGAFIRRSI